MNCEPSISWGRSSKINPDFYRGRKGVKENMWKRKRVIIANAFSTKMMRISSEATIFMYHSKMNLEDHAKYIGMLEKEGAEVVSIISHKDTSEFLLGFGFKPEWVKFNRVNFEFQNEDLILCFCPNFRPEKAREMTPEELLENGFTVYGIDILSHRCYGRE